MLFALKMESVEELKELLVKQFDGLVTVIAEPRSDQPDEPFRVADAFVASHGFKQIHKAWKVISSDSAVELLTRMLTTSLAYDVELMRPATAEFAAKSFRAFFDQYDATCMANGTIEDTTAGWTPITKSTFEMAVVIYDEKSIGMICVEDED